MIMTINFAELDAEMDKHLTTFTVEGRGTFPLDMLRRDQCWPVGPDDVARMGLTRDDAGFNTNPRCVRLTKFSRSRWPQSNTARWESFGWKVIEATS